MVFLIIIVEVEKPDDEEEIESKEEMKIDNKEENKEGLAYDNSAYEMFHRASLDWPCLSIDFVLPNRLDTNFDMFNPHMKLPESLLVDYVNPMTSEKSKRHKEDNYPYTVYMVGGTQTDPKLKASNKLYVFKMFDMYKTQYDDQSESDDDENNFDDDPNLLFEWVPLKSAINRVRTMNNSPITTSLHIVNGRLSSDLKR